jgi:hypothetical protein
VRGHRGFQGSRKIIQVFSSPDPIEEIDIGDGITPRPTFINKNMSLEHKDAIMKLLKEYVDCFVWNYREMPKLNRELVEHRLSIKFDFRPYKQTTQRFNLIIHDRVKEEVGRLLDAGFIRPCPYVKLVSNIVPVENKNIDKICLYIDFHNLNKTTPKEEYPMPICLLIMLQDIVSLAF